jgi:hypothetical protein
MASETELQRSVMKALRSLGIWCIRVHAGHMQGIRGGYMQGAEAGTPDLCLPALGFLEVKLPGGKVNEDQAKWHARAEREGVRVAVVRSTADAVRVVRSWRAEARG